MKIWITSDTHFGHKKMVEYCGRPEDFSEKIYYGLAKIPKNDMLIHLGDVCIGDDLKWHSLIKDIPCRKILVRGNHDHKSNNWYMEHGWDFVAEKFSWWKGHREIVFSHQPEKVDPKSVNIYGHFHNNLPRLLAGKWIVDGKEYRNTHDISVLSDNHILFSQEEEDYWPVPLDTLLSRIDKI